MGEFSLPHILIVLVIVLVFFGPKRLPGLGKSIGEAIRGFKSGIDGLDKEEPKPPVSQQALDRPQPGQTHTTAQRDTVRDPVRRDDSGSGDPKS
jgi:sec-independent protein translocase protein TatA